MYKKHALSFEIIDMEETKGNKEYLPEIFFKIP